MANILWKNFNLCFSKLKNTPITCLPQPPPSKQDHTHPSNDSSSAAMILIKSFNSIYDLSSNSTSKSLTHSTDVDFFSSSSASSSESSYADSTPDFATVFASQRFFFSSPGRTNSIMESPDTRPPDSQTPPLPGGGGVAVKKYSPDPYTDFRCSMLEMIEARNLRDVRSEWEFLNELLFCYLSLNPKHTHKFIIRAFADIIISLLSSPESDGHRKPDGHRR